MPLGLLPEFTYEEGEIKLGMGEGVLFYTDGIVEAHNPSREMFGFPRLQSLLARYPIEESVNQFVRRQLMAFTGTDLEQEDDITMVPLQREGS
jgi:sigma-B regulation protein RsbU (phosphoserine phosphatase)